MRGELVLTRQVEPRPSRAWLAVFLAPALLFGGAIIGSRELRCFGETKEDIARGTARRYAFEAYPSWLAAHPGQTCPRAIDELDEYMDSRAHHDPWGRRYLMVCDTGGMTVVSLGETAITSAE